jgi:ribose 5-phosphate isomerase A
MPVLTAKRRAAEKALDWVRDGMTIGLGTGTTAARFIELLGDRVRTGLRVRGVPTSTASAALANRVGVPLVDFETATELDLTVDGADEIDARGSALKGGGGALLREKIVAHATRGPRVAVVDETKWVTRLGAHPLPVEVVPFALPLVRRTIEKTWSVEAVPREAAGSTLLTDNGNAILECRFGPREDWLQIAGTLDGIPGIVCHGIFWETFDIILIGDERDVRVERARRER